MSYGKRELLVTGQILLLAALYKKSTANGKGLGAQIQGYLQAIGC